MSEAPLELALEEDVCHPAEKDKQKAAETSAQAFHFVEQLAAELSGDAIELPYLPDIAVRMRKLMNDPDCSLQQLGKTLSAEPGLAARLLRIANSAQYNRSGKMLTEVTPAVNRLGFELVRNTCWTYALAQMQRQQDLQPVADQLVEQWQISTDVASLAFVVARETNVGQPDEALMAGMIHNVGTVYILSRQAGLAEGSLGREALSSVIEDWNCSIGRAIAENWELAEETVEAVANYRQLDRIGLGHADLCDVLTVAVCLHEGKLVEVPELAAAQRMKLKLEIITRLMDEVDEERAALQNMLAL
ncbi:MAG: HDOD domain-containing protein [Gammaproteobacteria bacterium]